MDSRVGSCPRWLWKPRGGSSAELQGPLWHSWQRQAPGWAGSAVIFCKVSPGFPCWAGTHFTVIVLYAVTYVGWVWLLCPPRRGGNKHSIFITGQNVWNFWKRGGVISTWNMPDSAPISYQLLECRLNYCWSVEFNWESRTPLKCHLLKAAFSDCHCQNTLSLTSQCLLPSTAALCVHELTLTLHVRSLKAVGPISDLPL